MKFTYPILAAVFVASTSAAYAEQVAVAAVEVAAELSDVNNKKALEYYPDIGVDLQAAITEELSPLTGEDGYTVKVRVDTISLDGQPLRDDKGFNRLEGWVYVYPPAAKEQAASADATDSTPQEEFNIQLDATAMGYGIQPGSDDFYRAMVLAFAQSTGEKVMAMEAVAN